MHTTTHPCVRAYSANVSERAQTSDLRSYPKCCPLLSPLFNLGPRNHTLFNFNLFCFHAKNLACSFNTLIRPSFFLFFFSLRSFSCFLPSYSLSQGNSYITHQSDPFEISSKHQVKEREQKRARRTRSQKSKKGRYFAQTRT